MSITVMYSKIIHVHGENLALEAASLVKNEIITIYGEEDDSHRYSAHSDLVENLSDEEEILNTAFILEAVLRGALLVSYEIYFPEKSKYPNLSFSEIEISGCKTREFRPYNYELGDISSLPHQKLDSFRTDKLNSPLLVELCKLDENIINFLINMGLIRVFTAHEKMSSWSILYKLLDWTKTTSKKLGMNFSSLVNEVELNKFTAACNNESILGLNARHGANDKKKPGAGKVMANLDDAIELIVVMVHEFLVEYINQKFSLSLVNGTPLTRQSYDASELFQFEVQ